MSEAIFVVAMAAGTGFIFGLGVMSIIFTYVVTSDAAERFGK